jgi:hypothetical protein
MYEKILLVVVGAILGKLLDLFLKKRRVNQLEVALMEELEDIKERLMLIRNSYERTLKIYALKGIDPHVPLQLSNPIFNKYYVDVALKLGASQRKSLSLIHSYVDAVNNGIKMVIVEQQSFTVENISKDTLDNWGTLVKSQYQNADLAYWHVNYHLSNKELPFLRGAGSEESDAMLAQRESTKKHIEQLIDDARKTLNRDDFI